jgi:hypothetical protein
MTITREEETVSQEPSEQIQQQISVQNEGSDALTTPSKGKKRIAKKSSDIDVEALSPRPSYWPFTLAVAVVVFLFGAFNNPYIMGVGIVLVAIAVIGWGLERR